MCTSSPPGRIGPCSSSNERYNLEKAPFKWFEAPIYKFINNNNNNEDSMRRASAWLTEHPGYRPDLVDA